MSGFSRCHRFVLYSWHITVPSVRRRQCSANPDGNAFASGVHCALAIDDQQTRTISAIPELDMFLRQRFCICLPRLASQRLVSQIKIVTINASTRSTSLGFVITSGAQITRLSSCGEPAYLIVSSCGLPFGFLTLPTVRQFNATLL